MTSSQKERLFIAVVGPMTGKAAAEGQDMANGAQMYVDQLNEAGGINGRKIELLIYDDQNDPELAREVAQDIADSNNILLVIGHMFSSTSIAAGEIYEAAGIPAISGSATAENVTAERDFYFRTIPTSHAQAAFLANYANRIMGETNATVIYDSDAFGRSLAESYVNTFRGLGGEIRYTRIFNGNSATLTDDLDNIVRELIKAENGDPGLIFLATHTSEAKELIIRMRRQGMENILMGSTALGNPNFIEQFTDLPEEHSQPGFFLDNLYATTPILFDVVGEEAQQFREDYIQTYGSDPGLKAPSYYDTATVALAAIKRANVTATPETIATDRQSIRAALAGMSNLETGVKGLTGNQFFNPLGDVIKPLSIGVFSHQRFVSALTQLQPVPDLKRISDLQGEIDAGRVLIVNGKHMYRTNVVYTGIDINEVIQIDTKASNYTIDFYLWFRHQGDFDETNIQFVNSQKEIILGDPIAEEITDGYVYRAYHVKTELEGDFNFKDYPFDTQSLKIQIRHNELLRENLIYVVDVLGLRNDSPEEILAKLERSEAFKSISGWHIKDAVYYTDFFRNESTLGNPNFLLSDSAIEFSDYSTELIIERNVVSFLSKNLLPLMIILMLAYVVFYIPIQTLSPRIIISVNALLTISFFHLRLGSDLPGIGYLIALDYAFYGIYILIAGKLLITVLANLAKEREDFDRLEKLNNFGKVAYPAAIVLGVLFFIIQYDLISPPSWVNQVQIAQPASAATEQFIEAAQPADGDVVTLKLQSWRVDDLTQMERILAVFNEKHPNIQVEFQPTVPAKYDDALETDLEHGIAADLFYLRSFSHSRKLIDAGYIEPLTNLPGLYESFSPDALQPWTSREQVPYGVPFIAVSHAIYYNQEIFQEMLLPIPQTWAELEEVSIQLQEAGIIPFANASGDPWTMAELVFMNLAPNFIGGKEGRLQYLNGQRCFNDSHVVDAFTAVSSLSPFLPPDHQSISYPDSRWLFLRGEAAMMFSGSWDISYFENEAPDFQWSIFATPPPDEEESHITFHADTAIGLNANSPYKEEARLFLTWLTTNELANLLGNELPGFFPMHNEPPQLQNIRANTFLALNHERGLDVRWAWPQLTKNIPSGYDLMQEGTIAVINNEMTPEEAAQSLQAGLGQWFEPAQRCGQTAVSATNDD
ncbi:MAG: extracellular solute-binding protein [Chloroflexota bacterium]